MYLWYGDSANRMEKAKVRIILVRGSRLILSIGC